MSAEEYKRYLERQKEERRITKELEEMLDKVQELENMTQRVVYKWVNLVTFFKFKDEFRSLLHLS